MQFSAQDQLSVYNMVTPKAILTQQSDAANYNNSSSLEKKSSFNLSFRIDDFHLKSDFISSEDSRGLPKFQQQKSSYLLLILLSTSPLVVRISSNPMVLVLHNLIWSQLNSISTEWISMNRLARVARMPMISYQLSHDAKLTLVMNQIKISKYSKTPFFTYNIQIVVTIQHTPAIATIAVGSQWTMLSYLFCFFFI